MAVQVLDFIVRAIRGAAPVQGIGAITMVIKTGPVIRIIKEVIIIKAISRVTRVVTIIKAVSSMAKVVTTTKAINSRAKGITIIRGINSISNSSRNPDIRVIQRN